ncbi:DoxX family protein [Austwickia chelonae]|uniref:DoxX family protein n=1 Tax=Austwickia chelonae TaxID=100225 RepID=UPI000E24BED2|nr:DoxX family protein [Austwickia chelonae]
MTLVRRVARPALAAIFVTGGIDALRNPGTRSELARPVVETLSGLTGLPNDPALMVRVNGAIMAIAGLALATGRMPRAAGGLLAASLIPTTYAAHAFWKEEDPATRRQQSLHFQKNLGLLGGVLLAAVDTSGKPGLVWRARQAARSAKREARLAAAEAKLKVTH